MRLSHPSDDMPLGRRLLYAGAAWLIGWAACGIVLFRVR